MVSELNRSKNFSKMKSPKSNGRSRRNKLSLSKDQPTKTPKKEPQSHRIEVDATSKIVVKSGSWKRTSCPWDSPCNSKPTTNINESTYPSLPTKYTPGVLYSDVVFSGDKAKTPVKIKNLTPRHAVKINSRSRKRLLSMEKTIPSTPVINKSKESCSSKIRIQKVNKVAGPYNSVPQSSTDLHVCIDKLIKRLHIDVPAWNFEDFDSFNDTSPPFLACHFDDYNYLACENVALVGLRLASDGKFRS